MRRLARLVARSLPQLQAGPGAAAACLEGTVAAVQAGAAPAAWRSLPPTVGVAMQQVRGGRCCCSDAPYRGGCAVAE